MASRSGRRGRAREPHIPRGVLMPWLRRGGQDDAAGAVPRVRALPGFSANARDIGHPYARWLRIAARAGSA
jgi:hypothetical protein